MPGTADEDQGVVRVALGGLIEASDGLIVVLSFERRGAFFKERLRFLAAINVRFLWCGDSRRLPGTDQHRFVLFAC